MLKTQAQLEVKINDRIYALTLPNDAPLGEAHDALFQMRSFVVEKINEAHKADLKKEVSEEEKPVEV